MNDREFRLSMLKLGLHTHGVQAKALGLHRKTVWRFSQEGGRTPPIVDRLVQEWLKRGRVPKEYL